MYKEDETGSANKQPGAKEEPVTQDDTLGSEVQRAHENKENFFLACNRSQNGHAIFSEENREAYLGKRQPELGQHHVLHHKPSKRQAAAPFCGLLPQPREPVFEPADLDGDASREGSGRESADGRPRQSAPASRRPRRPAVAYLEEIVQHLLATDVGEREAGLGHGRVQLHAHGADGHKLGHAADPGRLADRRARALLAQVRDAAQVRVLHGSLPLQGRHPPQLAAARG